MSAIKRRARFQITLLNLVIPMAHITIPVTDVGPITGTPNTAVRMNIRILLH